MAAAAAAAAANCAGGGGGGISPCLCASLILAAICFFHFVLLFWNQVLICTSVRLRHLDSSSRFETDKYLSI